MKTPTIKVLRLVVQIEDGPHNRRQLEKIFESLQRDLLCVPHSANVVKMERVTITKIVCQKKEETKP